MQRVPLRLGLPRGVRLNVSDDDIAFDHLKRLAVSWEPPPGLARRADTELVPLLPGGRTDNVSALYTVQRRLRWEAEVGGGCTT
jgi:hypothetical protein